MKKILFVTSSFPYGISEGFANAEIKGLAECGARVTVLPTYPRGEFNSGNVNVETINLPLFRLSYVLSFLRMLFGNPRRFAGLVFLCFGASVNNTVKNIVVLPKLCHFFLSSKERYDFVLAYWASIPAQFAMLYSFLTGCAWGLTGHRWDIVEKNNFAKKFARARFIRLISASGVRLLGSKYSERFAEKIEVVHLGVDTAAMGDVEASLASTRMVCIANLSPVKGLEHLIDAMKDVTADVTLDLIGDGPLRQALSERVVAAGLQERVKLLGALPHSEVTSRLLSGAYGGLVLPSVDLGGGLHEGIPVVLMEAMASGVPVISTRTGGIPELLGENSEFGICVEEKSPGQLAKAINDLLTSRSLRESYAARGRERVLEKFDNRKNTRALYEMMAKAAAAG